MENPIEMDDLGVPLFSETSNERVRGFHDESNVSLFSGQPTHSFKDMARNLGDGNSGSTIRTLLHGKIKPKN